MYEPAQLMGRWAHSYLTQSSMSVHAFWDSSALCRLKWAMPKSHFQLKLLCLSYFFNLFCFLLATIFRARRGLPMWIILRSLFLHVFWEADAKSPILKQIIRYFEKSDWRLFFSNLKKSPATNDLLDRNYFLKRVYLILNTWPPFPDGKCFCRLPLTRPFLGWVFKLL